jgi:hypothetical protein
LRDHDDDEQAETDDPEMGNTSADVWDAETRYIDDDDAMPSPTKSENSEHETDQVAAFSQVQGSGPESGSALEFVAHQLVDPSNPVPQMESNKSGEGEKTEDTSKDWWESTGNDSFAFTRVENEGGFNDDFNPTNGMRLLVLLMYRHLKPF